MFSGGTARLSVGSSRSPARRARAAALISLGHGKLGDMVLTEEKLLRAVHHIVHDYANLVSAGMAIPKAPPPPLNSHVAYSFVLQSRKFADFFLTPTGLRHRKDILACDYVGDVVRFDLPEWEKWWDHMNCHMFHLSYRRLDEEWGPWDGGEHPVVLGQFQAAWKKFLACPPRFKEEFDKQIDEKLEQVGSEQGLVLR